MKPKRSANPESQSFDKQEEKNLSVDFAVPADHRVENERKQKDIQIPGSSRRSEKRRGR